jgi:AcrR family transcriptional regulator
MMARLVKEYDERRCELLDAAQHLFMTKGYDQTSVNDVIDRIGVSKGAFYHYFRSKEDLLDALTERLTEEGLAIIQPVLDEPGLDAVERLNRFFAAVRNWKADQMPLMMAVLRAVYSADNLLLRHKMAKSTVERTAPLLAQIIEQGLSEGRMDVANAQLTSQVVMQVGLAFREAVAPVLLQLKDSPEELRRFEQIMLAHQQAIERILGAPSGSLQLLDEGFIDALKRAVAAEPTA